MRPKMKESFFNPKTPDENQLYGNIRDNIKAIAHKNRINDLWQKYKPYAHKGFKKKAQKEFIQLWWEMFLTIGIKEIGCNIEPIKSNAGPDIKIQMDNYRIWIEAVVPQTGEGKDKVHTMEFNKFPDYPSDQLVLRLSSVINEKKNKFEKYINKGIVKTEDLCIIAVCTCGLNKFASLDQYLPLRVLSGLGNQTINLNTGERYYLPKDHTLKQSGTEIDSNLFNQQKFEIISAILYSDQEILDTPPIASKTFRFYINPKCNKSFPSIFIDNIETWKKIKKSKNTVEWIKIIA